MAEEKTKEDLLEKAAIQTEFGYEKYPSPRKYKKKHQMDKDWSFEIGVGTKVIMCVYKDRKDVIGYALGEVVDMDDSLEYWDARTLFIVKVMDVSNPAIQDTIGHLRTAKIADRSYWFDGNRAIVDVGKGEWSNYTTGAKKHE